MIGELGFSVFSTTKLVILAAGLISVTFTSVFGFWIVLGRSTTFVAVTFLGIVLAFVSVFKSFLIPRIASFFFTAGTDLAGSEKSIFSTSSFFTIVTALGSTFFLTIVV